MILGVGDRVTVEVRAREKWNDTGIEVVAHGRYDLHAAGEWVDWKVRCGPQGFGSTNLALRMSERLRRLPAAPWFMLVGAIGKSGPHHPIGRGTRLEPAESGPLYCFANDLPFMYWNNSGSIQLSISRTA